MSLPRWVRFVVAVCGLVALLRLSHLQARHVPTGSRAMEPTLLEGDRFFVSTVARQLRAGDLVVVDLGGSEYVRRVVATVGNEAVYLAADNPAAGADSRQWGLVPTSRLRGRPVITWYSPHPGRSLRWLR